MEDVALVAAARYFWYAERFGWDPDRVDALPGWLEERLVTVAAVHDEVQADKQKSANAAG